MYVNLSIGMMFYPIISSFCWQIRTAKVELIDKKTTPGYRPVISEWFLVISNWQPATLEWQFVTLEVYFNLFKYFS